MARADSGTACRLANSTTFQRLAWHGTEAAKKAGKDGTEAVKNSALYRTGQYKAMEQMNRLKQTEAFKEVESSAAFKTLSRKQLKNKRWKQKKEFWRWASLDPDLGLSFRRRAYECLIARCRRP